MFMELVDVGEDEVVVPKRLGLCAAFIGAFERCGKVVLENDLEADELMVRQGRKQFICGSCVNRLLGPKPAIEESEKPEKAKSVKHGRTGPRLPQGEDL